MEWCLLKLSELPIYSQNTTQFLLQNMVDFGENLIWVLNLDNLPRGLMYSHQNPCFSSSKSGNESLKIAIEEPLPHKSRKLLKKTLKMALCVQTADAGGGANRVARRPTRIIKSEFFIWVGAAWSAPQLARRPERRTGIFVNYFSS